MTDYDWSFTRNDWFHRLTVTYIHWAKIGDITQMGDGKNPSQNELSGENPSGENPSKVSCGENPSPYFGACGENPSPYFGACGENPSTL